MSQNPGTATTCSAKKNMSPCERWEPFPNVRMSAAPLSLRRDERCTPWTVRVEGRRAHGRHKRTQTPRANRPSPQPRAPGPVTPAREGPCTGHTSWGGFLGSPGVMPITPRTNVHSDFTSFRNQILRFSPTTSFFAWKRWNRMEPIPNSFTLLVCTTKRREQITTLPNYNSTSGDLVFILFI